MLNTSTYSTMSKWLKWSSLLILLIPFTTFIMALVNRFNPFNGFEKTVSVFSIVLLVLSVIWIILNIILFLTAGTVKEKASPTNIRIGLIISFVLVLAPEIVSLLMSYNVIKSFNGINALWLCMPLIVVLGYVFGFFCARSAQQKTN